MGDIQSKLVNRYSTNNKDLVELAGLHAYMHKEIHKFVNVNGKEFKVVDTSYNNPSGFDAFTVKNRLLAIFCGKAENKESTNSVIFLDFSKVLTLGKARQGGT